MLLKTLTKDKNFEVSDIEFRNQRTVSNILFLIRESETGVMPK